MRAIMIIPLDGWEIGDPLLSDMHNFRTSARNVVIEKRQNSIGKWKQTLLCGDGTFVRMHRGHNPDHGAVTATHFQRISNQVELRPVFTGDAAVMGPIPIQHDLP